MIQVRHVLLTVFGMAGAAVLATPSAVDELLPVPVEAALTSKAKCAHPEKVRVVTAAVPGAPAATADEAYVLEVAEDGVTITASSKRGEIWARSTLRQLTALSGGKVPTCRIADWPRYRWRGFMHDSARNFLELKDVKGILDAMNAAKMNLFHWHLTEYYGWRLESRRYPRLNADSSFYIRDIGKYYTQDQFREVVAYAAERGITVMPEFDIPGHALSFRRAFGFKAMRDKGTREKLCDLIDELCSLAPAEVMPFIHLGTDEAWLDAEKVPPLWMAPLVDCVHRNGRTVVGWTPGELAGLTDRGPVAGIRWGTPKKPGAVGNIPFFDAMEMYLDSLDPFEILPMATYRRICPWDDSEGEKLGAITCAWHDDFAGSGFRSIVNQTVLPGLMMFGDSFWRGRERQYPRVYSHTLPNARDTRLAPAIELERRMVAQRDKVFRDSPYPFQFLRQTDLRWRVTDEKGRLRARNIPQATVFMWQGDLGKRKLDPEDVNFFTNRVGVATLETWIRSPDDQDVGAWIGFTDFCRDQGRAYNAPTPDLGQWSKYGATVEINGVSVPPPGWKRPKQLMGKQIEGIRYVHELDEIPFEDEEYYMRDPTPIHLKAGWNHVKLVVPMPKPAHNHCPWVATFIPMLGTTYHPREVLGLEYSADPPDAFPPAKFKQEKEIELKARPTTGHLQDVWYDGEKYIYWAHTGELFKTDLEGNVVRSAVVGGHHAGLEVRNGRLYTAVCAFNGEPRGWTSPECHVMIGEYDAETLERIEMHVLDINDRAGSLAMLDDGTFIVGCLRPGNIRADQIRFHHIGRDFKLIRSHVLDNVPVMLGIETIHKFGDSLYFGLYGRDANKNLLDFNALEVKIGDFREVWRGHLGSGLGIAVDGDSVWLGTCAPVKGTNGYRSSIKRDGKIKRTML